jgi:DNA-binding NtrC family response regulator
MIPSKSTLPIPRVLLFTSSGAEAELFQDLLRHHASVTAASSLADLRRQLASADFDAVLCSWSFRAFGWSDVVEELQRHDPNLPAIVISPSPEDRVWLEVLEAGAFDLLVPPHRDDTVLAVLTQAAASRQARESRPCASTLS